MRDAVASDDILNILLAGRQRLVDIAQRVLKCRARAEDVVQEIALRLCEDPPCRHVSNPHAYVTRMVRNAAVDSLRRTRFECRLLAPIAAAERATTPYACPLDRIELRETLRAVATALSAAPARARRALIAHRLDAVPQKAIAAELGVSPTLVNFMIRDTTIICRDAAADDAMPPLDVRDGSHRRGGTMAMAEAG